MTDRLHPFIGQPPFEEWSRTPQFTRVDETEKDDSDGVGGICVTTEVDMTSLFGRAVLAYCNGQQVNGTNRDPEPIYLLTTDPCWSGYSEYTITDTWDELWLTVMHPDGHGFERHFDGISQFFAALGTA